MRAWCRGFQCNVLSKHNVCQGVYTHSTAKSRKKTLKLGVWGSNRIYNHADSCTYNNRNRSTNIQEKRSSCNFKLAFQLCTSRQVGMICILVTLKLGYFINICPTPELRIVGVTGETTLKPPERNILKVKISFALAKEIQLIVAPLRVT